MAELLASFPIGISRIGRDDVCSVRPVSCKRWNIWLRSPTTRSVDPIMAAYSDTTNEVLELAFDNLRGAVPHQLLAELKRLTRDGKLDDLAALKKAIAEVLPNAQD